MILLSWLAQDRTSSNIEVYHCNTFTVTPVSCHILCQDAFLFCPYNCGFDVHVSGLVGSAYYLVAFQPDTAVAALQKATSTTVTMGKYSRHSLIISTQKC